MIVCTVCGAELERGEKYLICPAGHCRAEISGGIVTFGPAGSSQDYDPAMYGILSQIEKDVFWFRGRNEVILQLFAKYVNGNERVIDIGTGTGAVARALFDNGYKVAVSDIHAQSLVHAMSLGIKELYRFDLLDAPFKEHFDVVGIFDVVEHLEDDASAVKKIHQLLVPGGKVIATVPAYPFLWNNQDVAGRHKRRYTFAGFAELFQSNGFEVVAVKGFNIFILPLLLLRALTNGVSCGDLENEIKKLAKIRGVTNSILLWLTRVENLLFRRIAPRFGGSIALVAVKK